MAIWKVFWIVRGFAVTTYMSVFSNSSEKEGYALLMFESLRFSIGAESRLWQFKDAYVHSRNEFKNTKRCSLKCNGGDRIFFFKYHFTQKNTGNKEEIRDKVTKIRDAKY